MSNNSTRKRYLRKVIRITAEDSPNVRLALAQKAKGLPVTNEELVPGVIDYQTYINRRKTWDAIRQCVGLDARFYKGAEVLLYPPDWLDRAASVASSLRNSKRIGPRKLGVDTGEGGDDTCWVVADELGVLYLRSKKTPDTSIIYNDTIGLMREYNLSPDDVLFDSGGGGKEHADYLRKNGFNVHTIGFGESVKPPQAFHRIRTSKEKKKTAEERYVYKNRRAQMYGLLRELLNPIINPTGFGLPEEYRELRRQLAPLPLLYDGEGRIYLPPKRKRPNSKETSIEEILGCSPDQADALVLAVYGLVEKPKRATVGSMV